MRSKPNPESLGQELRRLREQRGWTLEAAAQITKIKPEQLHDLEADNYDNFPSAAYVRGFVRIYARALGLDDHKVIAKLEGRIDEEEEELTHVPPLESLPPVTKVRQPTMQRIGGQIIGLVAILIIVGIIFVLWRIGQNFKEHPTDNYYLSQTGGVPRAVPLYETNEVIANTKPKPKRKPKSEANIPRAEVVTPVPVEPPIPRAEVIVRPETPPPAPPPVEPLPEPQAVPAEPVASTDETEVGPAATETNQLEAPRAEVVQPTTTLQLQATDEVWLRVIVNGNESRPAYDGVMAPGQSASWQGQRFYIVARPPSALLLTVNGQSRGQLSQSASRQEFTIP
jgi:cytoskeletal protein RodZ